MLTLQFSQILSLRISIFKVFAVLFLDFYGAEVQVESVRFGRGSNNVGAATAAVYLSTGVFSLLALNDRRQGLTPSQNGSSESLTDCSSESSETPALSIIARYFSLSSFLLPLSLSAFFCGFYILFVYLASFYSTRTASRSFSTPFYAACCSAECRPPPANRVGAAALSRSTRRSPPTRAAPAAISAALRQRTSRSRFTRRSGPPDTATRPPPDAKCSNRRSTRGKRCPNASRRRLRQRNRMHTASTIQIFYS